MTELLTAAQMRAIESAAIASGNVTGLELMERAGRGVVEAIFEEWPELHASARRAVVLCGPGNNGGDGFVVARLLKEMGWEVEVFLFGDPARLPPYARVNFERWAGPVQDAGVFHKADKLPCDLSVDALFGTGLQRPIDDPILWERLWAADNLVTIWELRAAGVTYSDREPTLTVAVDVPSGLDADTGQVIGAQPLHGLRCARAMLTVTFHALKRGHVLGEWPELCGKVVVKDIGLSKWSDAPHREV